MPLERLIFLGGILHFGILFASASVPHVLNWQAELRQLDPLFRQLIWVHGAFIVLVIVGFGLLSVWLPQELADGSPLARGVCLFIAVFWGTRLLVQLGYFDASVHLNKRWLRLGYHGLTCVFIYHATIYGWAAIFP
ncbi:MAG: hypothetical protein KDA42_04295 [Planctomycetales bacterium]|nr:hypothetical protein [Planctomycetales bacterium]